MSDTIRDPSSEERRLEEALAEYLLAEEQGRPPGRKTFLDRYPELADRLRAFLDNKERLEGLAGARNQITTGEGATVPPATPATAALPASAGPAAVPGYEVLEELGRGGMGVVYKARQVKLDRVVALKMILAGAHAGRDEQARFQAEAEAIARLSHPGIVQVYEVGEHDGLPFFSLEFCPGGSLDRKLAGTPLPPREAAALVEGIARAMHAAHEKGIVHRDLKPANVLLAVVSDGPVEQWLPKVTDFGLAKRLDAAGRTGSGAVLGTPSYMAPEQAGGSKTIGPAADVYALGAILYECLTGRPPFRADTPLDTLLQVVGDEPVPPRQLNPKVPRDLETICLKCLAKGPRKRYASAAALAEDLHRFRAGEPIQARPVGPLERAWRWCNCNPALAGLLALVALLLVGGTTVSTLFAVAAAEQAHQAEQLAEERASALRAVETEKEKFQEQLAKAEFIAYSLLLRQAQDKLERGRLDEAKKILHQCDPKLRRWEHDYLLRHTMNSRLTFKGHTQRVMSVAISADGKRIASGSDDWTVKVWDAQTGQEIRTLKGHTRWVNSVAFSADGKRIVSGSDDQTVKVWDAHTGQETLTLKGHTSGVRSVAFSPDGKRIASGSDDRTVKVWDAHTGQEIRTLQGHLSGYPLSVAFSADGTRIVSGRWQTVRVWDAHTGQETLTLKGHTHDVWSVAFSPDGTRIVSGSDDQTVMVWDAQTGKEVLTLKGHIAGVWSVCFSPDGERIASASEDWTVKVFEPNKILAEQRGN